jgi:hypothetical protein
MHSVHSFHMILIKSMFYFIHTCIHTRDGYRLFGETFPKNNVELYYIVNLLTT